MRKVPLCRLWSFLDNNNKLDRDPQVVLECLVRGDLEVPQVSQGIEAA